MQLKYLKYLLILVPLNCFGQKLKIEIFNKTGFDLDSIKVQGKYIGSIKKNSSIVLSDFMKFKIQDGLPFGFPYGVIVGEKTYKGFYGLCGTGMKTVKRGKFRFNLICKERETGKELLWDEHK